MIPIYHKICPEGVYEKEIKSSGCDAEAHCLRWPGEMAREMEKITAEHFIFLGIDLEELDAQNRLWVVAWSSIWIAEHPKGIDTMILRIWPGARKSVMCPRKYAFYTQEGKPLACASVLFVMMHSESRVLTTPTDQVAAILGVTLEGEPPLPDYQMVFPKRTARPVSRIVQKGEIDRNGHLNNTYYLDWAMELAEDLHLDTRTPHHIWVKYNKELVAGQKAELFYSYQKDVLYIHGISEGISSFMLAMDYRSGC